MPVGQTSTTVHVHATVPNPTPPAWAFMQRQLIDRMNDAVEPLREKYIRPDGSILWPASEAQYGIDALDDAYESFHNWPLFYLAGGEEKFLEYSHFEFDAINRQFSQYPTGLGYPMAVNEYQPAYDWFHQGEGNLFFYLLCMADPEHERMRERACRFAGFYMNEDPQAPNYDPNHRVIRCAHNGSVGPGFWNFTGPDNAIGHNFAIVGWGLPFYDVPGVKEVADLHDARTLKRYAASSNARRGRGDAVVNLAATTLPTVAFLMTGEAKYRTWVEQYVEAWMDRTRANHGILPDNVGLEGEIGEYIDGKWYGANYGWTHPHGWHSVGPAATIAAQNAALLSGDRGYLELPRSQIDILAERAIERDGKRYVPHRHGDPGMVHYRAFPFLEMLRNDDARGTPEDRADWQRAATALERDGWFEFRAMHPQWLAHLWNCSMDPRDMSRQRELAHNDPEADLAGPYWYSRKDQGGCHSGWLAYLRGELPDYPERILQRNLDQVQQRLTRMAEDTEDPATYGDSYLQGRNPITLEGLMQLTMGGPLPVYNGGLPQTRVRHFDPQCQRPGLPPDVAALVSGLTEDTTVLELCNLSTGEPRDVLVQAGAYGQHRFTVAHHRGCQARSEPPASVEVNDRYLYVRLEPGCQVRIEIGTQLHAFAPRMAMPRLGR